ncbi:unnamed protein product [Lepidochelys olivacea]
MKRPRRSGSPGQSLAPPSLFHFPGGNPLAGFAAGAFLCPCPGQLAEEARRGEARSAESVGSLAQLLQGARGGSAPPGTRGPPAPGDSSAQASRRRGRTRGGSVSLDEGRKHPLPPGGPTGNLPCSESTSLCLPGPGTCSRHPCGRRDPAALSGAARSARAPRTRLGHSRWLRRALRLLVRPAELSPPWGSSRAGPAVGEAAGAPGRTARWCESGGGEACGLVPGPERTSRQKQTADPDRPKRLPTGAITIAGRATRGRKQESIDCSPDFE